MLLNLPLTLPLGMFELLPSLAPVEGLGFLATHAILLLIRCIRRYFLNFHEKQEFGKGSAPLSQQSGGGGGGGVGVHDYAFDST